MSLDAEAIEAIAQRVAELVGPRPGTRLVDAAELAAELGVSTTYVYRHAARLGARRLGTGPKARLRFDVRRATSALAELQAPEPLPAAAPGARAPKIRRATTAPPIQPRSKGRPGAMR